MLLYMRVPTTDRDAYIVGRCEFTSLDSSPLLAIEAKPQLKSYLITIRRALPRPNLYVST